MNDTIKNNNKKEIALIKEIENKLNIEEWTHDKESERTIDNEYEALTETKRVYSRTPLNSDHVIAKLNQAEKELIIETVYNANYAMKILNRYFLTPCIPQWDKEKKQWKTNKDGSIYYMNLLEAEPEKAKECINNSKRIIDMLMIKINAIAIVNRNTPDNFMLAKGWYKQKEEEKVVSYSEDDRNMIQKIGDYFKGEQHGTME